MTINQFDCLKVIKEKNRIMQTLKNYVKISVPLARINLTIFLLFI